MNIRNAVVLITGANRGLGRALVEATLAAGARRIYATARDTRKLEALVRKAPEQIVPLALDITDGESLRAAAAKASDVTLLFNNAGVLASYDVLSSSAEQLQQDFATNFFGLVAATKAFLPALERSGASGQAAVVNVLSVASLSNVPSLGGYSASKAAAFSITQALRSNLAKKSIRVHGVFAGPIDTDMVRAMDMNKTSPADVAAAILRGVENGVEDISPDPVSEGFLATWQRSPKELELQFSSTMG